MIATKSPPPFRPSKFELEVANLESKANAKLELELELELANLKARPK